MKRNAAAVVFCAGALAVTAAFAGVEMETGAVFGKPVVLADEPDYGHAVALEGKILYASAGDRLFVFDTAADPLHPRLLAHLDLPGRVRIRQIAVENGYVFVSAREGQMMSVDCRDPANPKYLARYDCCELATGIDVAGGVCFLGQRQNGVEFIDVSDPARPQHIAMMKTEESQSVFYKDGFCYSGEWAAGRVTVFDCRDMGNIREVDKATLYGYGDGVWAQGGRLYAATGHSSVNRSAKGLRTFYSAELALLRGKKAASKPGAGAGHGLQVFDIADPAHPKPLGRVEFPPFYSIGFDYWTPRPSGDGRLVFSSQSFNGLFATDVSDPAAPKVVDRLVIPGETKKGAPGKGVASVAVGDGVVYAAVHNLGIIAVPAAGAVPEKRDRGLLPANVSAREKYPTDEDRFFRWLPPEQGQLRGLAVAPGGRTLLVAAGDAGLYAVDVEPGKGFGASRRVRGGKCFDVSVAGTTAVTAEGVDGGWGVYTVSADGSLVERKRLHQISGRANDAFWASMLDGKRAVFGERRKLFEVCDVTDPAKPKKVFSFNHTCPGWDRVLGGLIAGRWLCWNEMNRCITWCDLKAEKPERLQGSFATKISLMDGICPFGDKALIVHSNNYQLVPAATLRDPSTEDGVWSWPGTFPGSVRGGMPRTDGRYVLKTNRINRRAGFYDFADPAKPKLLWEATLSGNPDAGIILGGKAIIPCGFQGLLMAR